MKKVYEALYPIGYVEHEVADNFTVEVPYTLVKPLELENQQSQYYDFAAKTWKEAVTQDYSAKLELLGNTNAGLEAKSNQLEEENTRIKKDIATVKEQNELLDTTVSELMFEILPNLEGGTK